MNEISIDAKVQRIIQDVFEFSCYYNLILTEIYFKEKAKKVQEKTDFRKILEFRASEYY